MTIDAAIGKPVVVTVNVPALPTLNVVLLALVMAGAWLTVRVKLCVAFGVTPLFAVMVIGYVPPVPGSGVPASVAVPSLLLTNVTPLGSAPVSLMHIDAPVGKPVVVTVNVPATPVWNVVVFVLVIDGACCTVRVKLCDAAGGTPLLALMVIG